MSRSLIVPIWLRASSSLLSSRAALFAGMNGPEPFYRRGHEGRKAKLSRESTRTPRIWCVFEDKFCSEQEVAPIDQPSVNHASFFGQRMLFRRLYVHDVQDRVSVYHEII